MTMKLAVEITRFLDKSQPGWVEVEFTDAEGRRHIFRDKVPIFTDKDLDGATAYPQPGGIRCEIVCESSDKLQNRIDTSRPDDLESTQGLSEFVVNSTQLSKVLTS